jgi:hypothetical protein
MPAKNSPNLVRTNTVTTYIILHCSKTPQLNVILLTYSEIIYNSREVLSRKPIKGTVYVFIFCIL